jgi:outer membrane protein TolC
VAAEAFSAQSFRMMQMTARSLSPGRRRAAVLACALFAAIAVHAQPLPLDEALRLSEQRSRQLTAHDNAAQAAREMAVAAGQRPDPTLGVGVTNLPIDGPDRFSVSRDFMTMRSVSLMQQYTRADKLKARAGRFEREADTAQARRDAALAELRQSAAAAWLQLHWQQRLRELLVAQRDEARLQIDAADAAFRGGRGAQADIFAARSAVSRIEDQIAEADREVETARTMLGRWVGDDAAQRPLGAAPPTDVVHVDLTKAGDAWTHHPQIAVLARQEQTARAEAEVARAEQRADWSAEVMVSQRGSAYSNMVSLNLTVPLQLDRANRQQRELAARLAMVEQLRAEREEATRMHIAEAQVMLHEWRNARERLRRYDESLSPLAAQRTQAALAAYRGASGTVGLSSVLEARRAEIDTAVERMRLEAAAARLWAQLEYLVPQGSPQ